jgi:hypothetical protein
MKVSVTNKGEGYVEAKLEAETPAEAMILSLVGINSTSEVGLSLSSTVEGYGSSKKHMTQVSCGGFMMQTHDIVS